MCRSPPHPPRRRIQQQQHTDARPARLLRTALRLLLVALLGVHPPALSPGVLRGLVPAAVLAAGAMQQQQQQQQQPAREPVGGGRQQAGRGGGGGGAGGGTESNEAGFPLNSLNNALMQRLHMDHVPPADGSHWSPAATLGSAAGSISSGAAGAATSGSGGTRNHHQVSGEAAAALASASAAAAATGGRGGGAAGGAATAQLEAPPLLTRLEVRRALELAVKLGAANGSLLAATTRGARFVSQLGGIAGRAAALAAETRPERVVALLGELHVEVRRLPPGTSWPAVRRVIAAGLALHRLRAGPLAAAGELLAVQLLLRLYLAHRAAAKAKRVVEFAHVSKSGGTTMCQLAERNGCRTESFASYRNCLLPKFDDRPRYIDYAYHRAQRPRGVKTRCDRPPKAIDRRKGEVNCRRRRKIMLERGYNLYMNEYTALGGTEDPSLAHACSNMLTVLQLRHPYSRVLSHVKHMWHAYTVHCRKDKPTYFPHGHNATHWSLLLTAPLDNYLVRSLLGEAVFALPSGAVTENHASLARVLLMQQYDVLLVLEDPSISHTALSYGLGWAEQQLHVNSAAARSPEPGNDDGLPPDLHILYERNRHDLDLYWFGVVMAQLDAVVYDAAQALGTAGASLAALQAAAEEEEAEADYAAGLDEGELDEGEDYDDDEEDEEEEEAEKQAEEDWEQDYVDEGGRDQRGDSSAALTDEEGSSLSLPAAEEAEAERRNVREEEPAGGRGTSSTSDAVATSRRMLAPRRALTSRESVPPAALTPSQRAAVGCGFVGSYEPDAGAP
ncbi:hypothetical protein HYH02_004634 [Chlamydomonas schloesseri]|uniref:Uncharacterized protein n=1 Tax=Chlamydomonas schloesseri TaxID=2026947 RepID=A0A835WNW3_9CHLO|nr:hypothetical protein HYH02_004634 [Chlamydomonas schloesseri]|eukprot:KAG2450797.1 hypothetical protein HYH02_004634 [Chlamydomonas schloesseri]